jgi:hypothetical protein
MLKVQEISRPKDAKVIAHEDHNFGNTTKWLGSQVKQNWGDRRPLHNWKITCNSGTYTFGGGCYSYSTMYIEYDEDEKTLLFGGEFRNGESEKRDRPGLKIEGFKVLEICSYRIILEVLTGHGSTFFEITLVRPWKHHDAYKTTEEIRNPAWWGS